MPPPAGACDLSPLPTFSSLLGDEEDSVPSGGPDGVASAIGEEGDFGSVGVHDVDERLLVWLGGQKVQSIRHHAAVSRSFAGASKRSLGFGDAGPVSKGGRTCRVNGSIPTPGGSDVISVGRLVREQNVGLLEATTYAGVAAMCRR
jgi:hypothetical protein